MGAAAWTAYAKGNRDEALTLMRSAADLEDKSEKHAVTPGRLVPARELLGDMLLEMKRPADALKEFEASEKHDPNRFRGIYGAAQAAAAVWRQRESEALLLSLGGACRQRRCAAGDRKRQGVSR